MLDRISVFLIESAAVVLCATILILYTQQNKLIYARECPHGSRTYVWKPDSFNMQTFEDVKIKTSDGITLHAYFIPHLLKGTGSGDGKNQQYSPVTLVYCHANSGNMGHRLSLVKALKETLLVNVLIFSYRGYGYSEGLPSENGIKKDVDAVIRHIMDTPQLSDTKIILFGQSLGGAVAIYSASTSPQNLCAVVVENTFFNLKRLCCELFPYFSYVVNILLKDKWYSNKLIPRIPEDVPVLFICGSDDKLVNNSHSKDLFKILMEARNLSKEGCESNVELAELFGGHNDTCTTIEYIKTIRSFIFKHVPDLEKLSRA